MGIDAKILVRVKRQITDAECRQLGNRLCGLFGHEKFMFGWRDGDNRHVIYPIEIWEQDGPDIVPDPGETFLEVDVDTRYYGKSYERGDFPFLYMLGRALELLIPGCVVWYGGDSSGVLAEPFDENFREDLMAHFLENGHDPYRRREGPLDHANPGEKSFDRPTCELCQRKMNRFGYGRTYAAFCCECGMHVINRDGKIVRSSARDRMNRRREIENKAVRAALEADPALAQEYHEAED